MGVLNTRVFDKNQLPVISINLGEKLAYFNNNVNMSKICKGCPFKMVVLALHF